MQWAYQVILCIALENANPSLYKDPMPLECVVGTLSLIVSGSLVGQLCSTASECAMELLIPIALVSAMDRTSPTVLACALV